MKYLVEAPLLLLLLRSYGLFVAIDFLWLSLFCFLSACFSLLFFSVQRSSSTQEARISAILVLSLACHILASTKAVGGVLARTSPYVLE